MNAGIARESPVRIVVVDDSALFRLVIRDAISQIPGCDVVATAGDGQEALAIVKEIRPDLVTLDVEMPGLNGLETLERLSAEPDSPAVLMVSRHTYSGAEVATDALLKGAFDFILKPSGGSSTDNKLSLQRMLSEKISLFRDSVCKSTESRELSPAGLRKNSLIPRNDTQLVVVASSTGGPAALRQLIPALGDDLPAPVLIVQHMPAGFTASLSKRLNQISPMHVSEAIDGESLLPSRVYVVPGGIQTRVTRAKNGEVIVRQTADPSENGCKPSVDYVLRSVLELFGGKVLTVVMTGMGRDGLEGCRQLKAMGGTVFAQDQQSSVVYGMPRAVTDAGLVDRILDLKEIAAAVHACLM